MSSGSESDDDFVPGEPEQLSEEDSADEETEQQYENEQEHKAKKRKATPTSKGKKKIKTRNCSEDFEIKETEKEELPVELNPEEEKKREDDLWAKFLEGTDTKPKATVKETSSKPQPELPDKQISLNNKNSVSKQDDEKERERRIFEFAGETIVVENNVIKEKVKTAEDSAAASKVQGPSSRSRGAGLANVLDQINKKNKLSTLEKSKLDWNTYKQEEGIEEEIVSHNKGKAGYLDRKDFLERTDVRQYEIERDMRMSRRSNR